MADINAIVRANSAARSLRSRNVSSLLSARADPQTAPAAGTFGLTFRPAVNGKREIDPQVSEVSYLADDRKLVLPRAFLQTDDEKDLETQGRAEKIIATIRHLGGVTGIAAGNRYDAVERVDNFVANTGAGPPGEWHDIADGHANAISIEIVEGYYADDGTFEERASLEVPCDEYVTITYGNTIADSIVLARPLAAREEGFDSIADAFNDDAMLDQLSDQISIEYGLNYSVRDFGFLLKDIHTWKDDAAHDDIPKTRFEPKLTPYSTSVLAALNVPAVHNVAALAWTRAYGVSIGLVPHSSSLHSIEYQVTSALPEDAELNLVVKAHPEAAEGKRYMRGCLSIIGAFGACHLANDHTWKNNDDSLKRKAAVYVNACRTTFDDQVMALLLADGTVEHTIRTTSHCFGLASTHALFIFGSRYSFLAEPLRIRTTVVPPPVAKVGLIVSILDKILALPVGNYLGKAYSEAATTMRRLRTEIVARATQYSALHKHYGHENQLIMTPENEAICKNMLPVVSAYADVFERDENDNPIGARLSKIVEKCLSEEAALCGLYATAFTSYVNDSKDLKTLASGGSVAITRA